MANNPNIFVSSHSELRIQDCSTHDVHFFTPENCCDSPHLVRPYHHTTCSFDVPYEFWTQLKVFGEEMTKSRKTFQLRPGSIFIDNTETLMMVWTMGARIPGKTLISCLDQPSLECGILSGYVQITSISNIGLWNAYRKSFLSVPFF